ncbi:MAG TPA: hypothetical protein VGG64_17885 [Pirellulales bacterium]
MDEREEQFIVGIAAGLDPLTALAALPNAPTVAAPQSGWRPLGIVIAAVAAWFLLR